MGWGEIWTIIAGLLAAVVAIGTFLRNLKFDLREKIDGIKSDLGKRIDDLNTKVDRVDTKIDEVKHELNAKIDKVESKTESLQHSIVEMDKRLTHSINELDKRIQITSSDADKRLYAIEMILRMKECCMIKDEKQLKKAE